MKHRFRCLLSLLLCAAMLMSVLPAAAFADELDTQTVQASADEPEVLPNETGETPVEDPQEELPSEAGEAPAETPSKEVAAPDDEATPAEEDTPVEEETPMEEEPPVEEDPPEAEEAPEEEETAEEEPEEEEPEEEMPELTEEEEMTFFGTGDDILPSSQQLMMQFYNYGISLLSTNYLADRLRPLEYALYQRGVETIKAVAAGKQTSTVAAVSVDETEFAGKYFSAADLGISAIVENGKITAEAKAAMRAKVYDNCDFNLVWTAICGDCPYETYWSRNYYVYGSFSYGASWIDGEYQICFKDSYHIDFYVNDDFRGDSDTTVNPTRIANAAGAVNNAKAIVAKYASQDDESKIRSYAAEIAALNTYNDNAADGLEPYGGAWQLINVFDGDPKTNVVCAGYAHAFQYLCEISNFSQNIRVYSVTGDVYGSDGKGGAHQWNIVNIPSKENRLVDVTWYDGDEFGLNNAFILAQPEDITGGCRVPYSSGYATYRYDSSTLALYTKEELTFASANPIPVITAQPVDQMVYKNIRAVFTAEAEGRNLTLRWQQKAPGSSDWADIPGSAASTLEITGTMVLNGYQYRLAVTNASGTVYSDPAVLTVVSPAAITVQPKSVTVPAGEVVVFRSGADGDDLVRTWQIRMPNSAEWQEIECSASPELSVRASRENNGYSFRYVVTDRMGVQACSDAAVLTVLAGPEFLSQPETVTVKANETAVFTVEAAGDGLKYQWQFTANGTDWRNCSSVTAGFDTNTLKPVGTTVRNGYQYRCVITDASGKSIVSDAAVLNVIAGLTVSVQPKDQSVAVGETAVFQVTVNGSGLKYQWQYSTDGTDWRSSSAATVGYNTDTLKPVGTAARNGYQYRCVITDANGSSVTSKAAVLKVTSSAAIITAQPKDAIVSANQTAVFTVSVSGSGIKYQWQYTANGTDWRNCSAATAGYNTDTLKPVGTTARNGYQYRCVVTDASGKSVTSGAATLKVSANTGVVITAQPQNRTVALNQTAVFTVTASGSGLSYQWQYTANGTDWRNCSAATAGYNTNTLKPVGTAARSGYQYRCRITDSANHTVTSQAAVLLVGAASGPQITSQPADVSVSLGQTAVITVAVADADVTYQWQYTANGTDWRNCSAVTVGYNTDTLKPVGTAARNGYRYRCIITAASGSSVTTNAVTLTVR